MHFAVAKAPALRRRRRAVQKTMSYLFVAHRKCSDHVRYFGFTEPSELAQKLQPGESFLHFPEFNVPRARGDQMTRYKIREPANVHVLRMRLGP